MAALEIVRKSNGLYKLNANDLSDGHVYESENGELFVCCRWGQFIAASLTGGRVIEHEDDVEYFREVKAKLIIED